MARHGMGRGGDGVYRDPLPLDAKIRLVAFALLCIGAILFLVLRGCGKGEPSPQRTSGPVRISCVGDSITYGFGLEDRTVECWAYLLPGLLGDGSTVRDFGVSGTCALADGYAPWTRTSRAADFWEAEEDLVIFMLGTNDVYDGAWSEDAFERDCLALVEAFLEKPGSPQVIIMVPPALFSSAELDARLVDEAAPALERVAQRTGAGLIDLHALTCDHPEWFQDGVHPNVEGNAAIAAFIAEALRSA